MQLSDVEFRDIQALVRFGHRHLSGARFFLLAFLLNRYGGQARVIIEERLGFWVTVGAAVFVVGIIGALYLF